MIESLKTPIRMKLQLIPILRHMHHDANTAALVKTVCIDLLPKYPAESFVIVILDSLTQLTCSTLIDIPDQVNLLLTYLRDPRKKVRYQVLRSLQSLARKGAHLWPHGAQKSLISIAMTCNDLGNEQSLVLAVVLTLTNCPVTCHSLLNEEQQMVLELCSSCLVLEHHTAASQAIAILTSLISYCHTEGLTPPQSYVDQINFHLESLIYTSIDNEKLVKELSTYLKSGVKLSQHNLKFGERFTELIGGLLTDGFDYPIKNLILFCETLGALCSQFCNHRFESDLQDTINPFVDLSPKLLNKLQTIVSDDFNKEKVKLVEILSAVCLQSLLGCFMPVAVFDIFKKVFQVTSYWTQYRIARSASRFGHHFLAAFLYDKLSNQVSLEKFHFFLLSLSQISKAECALIYAYEYDDVLRNYSALDPENSDPNKIVDDNLKQLTLMERLDRAISLYWKALASLKASSSAAHPLVFQSEYVRLRGQFLEALYNAVVVHNTHSITPPPAIAQTLAQNSRDPLQKYGHVTNQLRKCVKTLKTCEENYSKLYKSAFDADPATLEYLEIAQFMCGVLAHSVESICFVSPSEISLLPVQGKYPETKYFIKTCTKMIKELEKLPNESGNLKSITNTHTEMILNQIEIVTRLTNCFPRFFFQILQNTVIKLSVSPQPRVAGEPAVVQNGSNLIVKVEGVVQHYGQNPSLFRSVDMVQLNLISQLISTRPNEMKPGNDTITLTQTVKPHRDFLSGSFLLPLSNQISPTGTVGQKGGNWQVTLEAYVIDGDGVVWNTGPKRYM